MVMEPDATVSESRPLEDVAAAAERVEEATRTLKNFVERFYGPGPEEKPNVHETTPTHNGNIQRLHSALDRLMSQVHAIDMMG